MSHLKNVQEEYGSDEFSIFDPYNLSGVAALLVTIFVTYNEYVMGDIVTAVTKGVLMWVVALALFRTAAYFARSIISISLRGIRGLVDRVV